MFSSISVAKRIGFLSLLTLIFLILIAATNLVFLNSIKKNASLTETNVVLLKQQTIKLLELSKAIQQGIFVVKAEGFSSIVAQKNIYSNEQYKTHKKKLLDLCKELDNFIVTHKKDDKELKDLSDTINKKVIGYLATIEMFQSDLEDNYKYTISTLDTQVKPKEDALIDTTNQILQRVTKKFNSTFTLMEESSIKTSDDIRNLNIIVMVLIIIALIIVSVYSTYLIKEIKNSLKLFQSGLNSFFEFLNGEKNNTEFIQIHSKDEFGDMAKVVNQNIERTEKLISEDKQLIKDAEIVMKRVNNGWYSQLIEKDTSNLMLQEFRNDVNTMIVNTKDRFVSINEILGEYAKNNYNQLKQGFKQLLISWLAISMVGVVMWIALPFSFKIWLNQELDIPAYLPVSLLLFSIFSNLGSVFIYFLNGTSSYLNFQLAIVLAFAALLYPLSAYLLPTYGVLGVVFTMFFANSYGVLFAPYLSYKVLKRMKSN